MPLSFWVFAWPVNSATRLTDNETNQLGTPPVPPTKPVDHRPGSAASLGGGDDTAGTPPKPPGSTNSDGQNSAGVQLRPEETVGTPPRPPVKGDEPLPPGTTFGTPPVPPSHPGNEPGPSATVGTPPVPPVPHMPAGPDLDSRRTGPRRSPIIAADAKDPEARSLIFHTSPAFHGGSADEAEKEARAFLHTDLGAKLQKGAVNSVLYVIED